MQYLRWLAMGVIAMLIAFAIPTVAWVDGSYSHDNNNALPAIALPGQDSQLTRAAQGYIPAVILPNQQVCNPRSLELMAAAACAIGRLTANNPAVPPPAVQLIPAGLPVVNTNKLGQPLCGANAWSLHYCRGVIVLGAKALSQDTPDIPFVMLVIAHEFGHHLRALAGVDFNDVEQRGKAAMFAEEQYADFLAGQQIRKQYDAGQISDQEVEALFDCAAARLGSRNDASHGTKKERMSAFSAGWQQDNSYVQAIGPSSIESR